jgi:hypothetical protein
MASISYMGLAGAGVLVVLGIAFVVVGRKRRELRALIRQTPVVPIAQLGVGQYAAVCGVAAATDFALMAPFANIPCVCYHYSVEQRVREVRDGRESDTWRTVDQGSERTAFTVTDATGSARVNLTGATLDMVHVKTGYLSQWAPSAGGLLGQVSEMLTDIAMLNGAMPTKVTVSAIPLNSQVYVLGEVQSDPNGQPMVAKENKPLFASARSKEQVVRSMGISSVIFLALGPILGLAGIVLAWFALTGRLPGHQ